MDFTLSTYSALLESLKKKNYCFMTFEAYSSSTPAGRTVVLRHDVDLLPQNALATARLEHSLGICATYYFRAVPESWDESIIREIASMGHEIGYHYESLTTAGGNPAAAFEDFKANLERLRAIAPVRTICMHGSPRSPFDSKDLWKEYSYKDLGLVGEPYLDTDFSKCFYLTDTGRRWDGHKVSVRDRVPEWQDRWNAEGLVFHSTGDIIMAIEEDKLPQTVMITTHPQRWTDNKVSWFKELLMQNAKNIVKRLIILTR